MPKRIAPLSAKQVDAARKAGGKGAEFVDGLLPGLRLRIGLGGGLLWSLAVRDTKGVMRRFNIGQDHSLSRARELARDLKQAVKAGADPTRERRAERQRVRDARVGIGTLRGLIDHYFEHADGAVLKTKDEQRLRILDVFKRHLDRPALDITVADLQVPPRGT